MHRIQDVNTKKQINTKQCTSYTVNGQRDPITGKMQGIDATWRKEEHSVGEGEGE